MTLAPGMAPAADPAPAPAGGGNEAKPGALPVGLVARPKPGAATTPAASSETTAKPDAAKAVQTDGKADPKDALIATHQSERDKATAALLKEQAKATTLESEIADLKRQVKVGPQQKLMEFQDNFEGWVIEMADRGFTSKQIADHLAERQNRNAETRAQNENRQKSVDSVISFVETLDPGFAKFLKAVSAQGTPVTERTLTSLKATYTEFGGGKAVVAAVVADPAKAGAQPGDEPPVTAAPGGAGSDLPDAPAWKPGMSRSKLWGKAVTSSTAGARRLTGQERLSSAR